jgi:chromate transporter
MIFLDLFITFFKIGLFGFGGGYGMLSLIQHESVERAHWLSTAEFTDIVAISQMTPGPIGINSATYCGYTAIHNAGYGHLMATLGSLTATVALVLPSLILMILISRMFMRYMNTHAVRSVFAGLRPAIVGLIAAAALVLMTEENFGNPKTDLYQFVVSVVLFVAAFIATRFFKTNILLVLAAGALAGIICYY